MSSSARRAELRRLLQDRDGIDLGDVIMDPARASLTSTVTFPHGNLAPEASVIKSAAIDPSVVGPDGVYRKTGPARVFRTEPPPSPPSRATGRSACIPAM